MATLSFRSASGRLDFYGSDGNDVVFISGAIDLNLIAAGGGADIISGSQAVSASGAELLMGAGNDTIVLSASEAASATVLGGGGADSITLDINTNDVTALELLVTQLVWLKGHDHPSHTGRLLDDQLPGCWRC